MTVCTSHNVIAMYFAISYARDWRWRVREIGCRSMSRCHSLCWCSYLPSPTCPMMRNRHFARFPLHLSEGFSLFASTKGLFLSFHIIWCKKIGKGYYFIAVGIECWIPRGATSSPNIYRFSDNKTIIPSSSTSMNVSLRALVVRFHEEKK